MKTTPSDDDSLVKITPHIWYLPTYHLFLEAEKPGSREIRKLIKDAKLMPVRERFKEPTGGNIIGNHAELCKHLQTITVEVTNRCMLGCSYCYLTGTGKLPLNMCGQIRDMDPSQLIRQVENVFSHSAEKQVTIQFIGGEPLIKARMIRDAIPILKSLASRHGIDLNLQIITNGILLGPKIIEYLSQEGVEVILSLEGPPAIQNDLRPLKDGGPSAEIILRNVAGAEKNISILMLLCKQTKNLTSVIRYFLDKGFKGVSFNYVYTTDLRLALTEDDCKQILDDIDANWDFYKTNHKRIRNFERIIRTLDINQARMTSCTAGRQYAAMGADGKFYLCQRAFGVPEFTLESLAKPESSYKAYTVDDFESCRGCWARYICGGICWFNAWHWSDDYRKVRCEFMRELIKRAIKLNYSP